MLQYHFFIFLSSRAIRSFIRLFWLQRLSICTESVKWRNTDLNKEPYVKHDLHRTFSDFFSIKLDKVIKKTTATDMQNLWFRKFLQRDTIKRIASSTDCSSKSLAPSFYIGTVWDAIDFPASWGAKIELRTRKMARCSSEGLFESLEMALRG